MRKRASRSGKGGGKHLASSLEPGCLGEQKKTPIRSPKKGPADKTSSKKKSIQRCEKRKGEKPKCKKNWKRQKKDWTKEKRFSKGKTVRPRKVLKKKREYRAELVRATKGLCGLFGDDNGKELR